MKRSTLKAHLESPRIQWMVETPSLALFWSALPEGLVPAEDNPYPPTPSEKLQPLRRAKPQTSI